MLQSSKEFFVSLSLSLERVMHKKKDMRRSVNTLTFPKNIFIFSEMIFIVLEKK